MTSHHIADIALPRVKDRGRKRMNARWAIVTIVLVMILFGLAITGDIVGPICGFRNQDLGYMILAWSGDIFFVYLVIDLLLLREERLRWRDVKDKVLELVKSELTGILTEVNLVTHAAFAATWVQEGATTDEMKASFKKAVLQRMKDLSQDNERLKAEADMSLLKGAYGTLFSDRAKRLGDLQLRYWSKFLEPEQMALIIDLQGCLESLHTHVLIASKYVQLSQQSESVDWTAEMYKDRVYKDLQSLLRMLSESVDKGMIEIP